MGCSMHGTAQALAKAYISQQHPGAHPAQFKRLFFLHFYGPDFEPKERKRIAAALSEKPRVRRSAGAGQAGNAQPITPKNAGHREGFAAGAVREKRETYGAKRKSKAKRPPGPTERSD